MAFIYRFVCNYCKYSVTAYEIGQVYYYDEHGKKQYVPHPSPPPEGVDVRLECKYLCMDCAKVFRQDHDAGHACPECNATNVLLAEHLEFKRCPRCRRGVFEVDESCLLDT